MQAQIASRQPRMTAGKSPTQSPDAPGPKTAGHGGRLGDGLSGGEAGWVGGGGGGFLVRFHFYSCFPRAVAVSSSTSVAHISCFVSFSLSVCVCACVCVFCDVFMSSLLPSSRRSKLSRLHCKQSVLFLSLSLCVVVLFVYIHIYIHFSADLESSE